MSKKYYIKTFGCQMNFSDSERIIGLMDKSGFLLAQNAESADVIIINTCGVRQMAEDRVYGMIRNIRRTKPEVIIVLTGCVAKRPDVQKRLTNKVDLFTDIKDFPKEFSHLMNVKSHDEYNRDYFQIAPQYNSSFQAMVPIMTGCNNFCAYCVVPYARGREASRPADEIIKEVEDLVKKGFKSITLLGQNVNSYCGSWNNKSQKTCSFPELLRKINEISGNFWIHFVSSHPKDMSDELIETVTSLEKICEYIHLPLQSGDDEIIRRMNRKYTQDHYLELINKIKLGFAKFKPDNIYAISSDIIVGFPGETDKQFLQSAKVMNEVGFDMVYFGQYSPRPGTAAWDMNDDVSREEKEKREKYLNEILKKTTSANNIKYIGRIEEVLIEKEKNGFYYGKTRTLKNIRIPIKKERLVGSLIKIKITKANTWNLEGEIC